MKNGINSFQLKLVTVLLMIVGITLQMLQYSIGYVIYLAGFPLASFLLVEAEKKTSDKKKLLLRLLLTAVLVEIPMDIVTFGLQDITKWGLNQNYYFTLCIGLATILAVERLSGKFEAGTMKNNLITLLVYLAAAFVAIFLRTEQSSIGVLLIVTMYLFYGNKLFMAVSTIALYMLFSKGIAGLEYVPALGTLLIFAYHGEQGKANKITRAVFYLAFPVAYCVLFTVVKWMK